MSSTLNTLIEGVSEIQRGNFSTAIELLEKYCENYEMDSHGKFSEYIFAQQQIIKAYSYLGEKDKAIQRTRDLILNEHPQVRKWAKRVLANLSPEAYQSLPQEAIENSHQSLWDSESARMILHSINDYLEFGSNYYIVEALGDACESIKVDTKEHYHAQCLLIEAYHSNEQFKDAVALCRELINSKHYLTRLIAHQYLSSLSENQYLAQKSEIFQLEEEHRNKLTSTQAALIYQQGYDALINQDYDNAFKILQQYCENTLPGTREYLQASQFLVDFYQKNGNIESATSLCLKLIKSNHKPSFRWSRELLFTDLFDENPLVSEIDSCQSLQSRIEEVKKTSNLLELEKSENLSVLCKNTTAKQFKYNTSLPFKLKTLDEFKLFCKENILKELKIFETRRKQSLITIIISSLVVIVILLCVAQLSPNRFYQPTWSNKDLLPLPLPIISVSVSVSWFQDMIGFFFFAVLYLFLIILVFSLYLLFYNSSYKCFTYRFDDTIVKKIFQFINTNNNFTVLTACSEKDNHQTQTNIHNSQILDGSLTNYIQQKHLIRGNINHVDIKIATVDTIFVQKHKNQDKKAKKRTSVILFMKKFILLIFQLFKAIPYISNRILSGQNIDFQRFKIEILRDTKYQIQNFNGIFFTAKFNTIYQPTIIIKPKLPRKKQQSIKLDNPIFNTLFAVYSKNQIHSQKILSPQILEKLIRFRKQFNRNISLSFIGDMMYIAIEYPEGIFKPNLFTSVLKFSPIREYFEAIKLMLGIVEDLQEFHLNK